MHFKRLLLKKGVKRPCKQGCQLGTELDKVQHTRNHNARTRCKEGVALKCQFNRGLSLHTAGLGHPQQLSRDIADFRLLGLPQIVELICAGINVLQVPVEVRARELARARERAS